MENKEQEIAQKIKEFSGKFWEDHRSPALLSALPSFLEKEGIPDYRTVLGPRTLKDFIKETMTTGGYKLVEHPVKQARVGVIPAHANYNFPPEPSHTTKTIPLKNNKEATLAFFHALATLPETDLEKVVIPASVLVKLLK